MRDLTVREAAIKADMIYQDFIVLVRNNFIPSYKIQNIYLIKEDDLDAWLIKRDIKKSFSKATKEHGHSSCLKAIID